MANSAEVLQELELIAKSDPDGLLRPEVVVAKASVEESPLHSFFLWDDSEAAHRFRLSQARQLIRTVTFVRETGTPGYVSVVLTREGKNPRRGYLPVDDAVRHRDAVVTFLNEAQAIIDRYARRMKAMQIAGSENVTILLTQAVSELDFLRRR